MRRHCLWLSALFLLGAAGTALHGDESTKEPTRGTTIVPDAVSLRQGGGLSVRTPVARPRSIKGVRSWTVETRRHRWAVIDFALSPDGATIATGGYDGMIRLWDAETGRLLRVLVGHDSYVYGLAFSPDGRYLASAGTFDVTVRVWEARTGLPVKVLTGLKETPVVVAWSPDGSLLAAGTSESGYVSIWKMATGVLAKTVSNGKGVAALAFSPDGKTLASWISTVGVHLRTGPGWVVDGQIDFPGQSSRALSYSADGKQLLVGGTKQSVIWDTAEKKVVRRYDRAAPNVARHGNRLAVSLGKVWDLDADKIESSFPECTSVAWSADGKSIYILQGNDVARIDPAKGTELKRWSVAESGTVWWYPGRPILTGIGSMKPQLWDPATGKPSHILAGHAAPPTALAWSPGGKVLATGGLDKTVRIWNPATGKTFHTLTGFEGVVTVLAVAGDGKIAAASADQKIRVFAAEGKLLKTFAGHTDAVRALAWNRDGRLASGGLDAAVRLWGMESSKPLHNLDHAGSVESLAYATNGKFLAAGAADHWVRIWTHPGRKLVHELESPGSPPAVTSLAWSADASQLIAGRANHTLQLWDAKLGKTRQSIGVMAPVQSVSWAAGGKLMASCTIDRCVRFWNPINGQIQTTIVADKDQLSGISTEGHYRIANDADTDLVCVVLTATGMDTFSPREFTAKFGWKNNPAKANLTGG